MVQLRRSAVPRWVVVCLAAAALLGDGAALATTVLPLSLQDLLDRSDVVAHVRVLSVRVMERDRVPFRVTTLEVLEGFQGARDGERLELWQRGDGYLFVIGDPWLEPGDEGLAFLRRVDGYLYLTALAQSFWWIDGQGADALARRDLHSLTILPLGAPRAMPPDRVPWRRLRNLVIETMMGVQP